MKTTDKVGIQNLVQQCLANGIQHAVISPGSRNAPIVIAMDEHPDFNCVLIHDERVAAFFALGMSQQLNQPVAVVCTSGSAVANYYPAVTEAYYQKIPLVVISADRPQEWINQGDGQTIMQQNIFGKHVLTEIQIKGEEASEAGLRILQRDLAVAFALQRDIHGPIHINVEINEPLYQTVTIEKETQVFKRIEHFRANKGLSSNAIHVLEEGMSLPKKMIIVGQMQKDAAFNQLLSQFASDTSVAVLVENTSNTKSAKFVHCIDRWLTSIQDVDFYQPDLLISFGDAVVSKKIKALLRKWRPKMHWKVGIHDVYMDTYQALTHTFEMDASFFLRELAHLNYPKNTNNYGSKVKQIDFLNQDKALQFIQKAPFSDLKVFQMILDYLPDGCHLHLANSSVVRYAQLFDPIESITYWSNRGTSGIDGSSSTACGAAYANSKDLHVLITGDVSFFYDSNAFWNNYLSTNLRIVLINNGGGDIFNIIPGPSETKQKDNYFVAKHQHSALPICELFDIEYLCVQNEVDLESMMIDFYAFSDRQRPKLMEIKTENIDNAMILKEFFNSLK